MRRGAVQWALATCALVGLVVVAVGSWPQALAATRGLEDAQPLLEKHIAGMFGKLGLLPAAADHRRVLAVLTYLGRDGR